MGEYFPPCCSVQARPEEHPGQGVSGLPLAPVMGGTFHSPDTNSDMSPDKPIEESFGPEVV
jgi:hypothetical protein